jgi:carboxypeptidase C (cathepsin A)
MMMIKFLFLLFLLPLLSARLHDGDDDMSCNSVGDENSCLTMHTSDESGIQCVWCSCAAIPSECLTQDQSQRMPPGVFDCKSPSSSSSSSSSSPLSRMTLQEADVSDDFCDANSKSGYIALDESNFNKDGENKHLFYWMFDKRESDGSDKTIPFIVWLTGGPGCSSSL